MHAMGTSLEGSTTDILTLVGELHAVPFELGLPRVYTVLKLDERSDPRADARGQGGVGAAATVGFVTTPTYASFGARALALLIDTLVITVPVTIALLVLALVLGDSFGHVWSLGVVPFTRARRAVLPPHDGRGAFAVEGPAGGPRHPVPHPQPAGYVIGMILHHRRRHLHPAACCLHRHCESLSQQGRHDRWLAMCWRTLCSRVGDPAPRLDCETCAWLWRDDAASRNRRRPRIQSPPWWWWHVVTLLRPLCDVASPGSRGRHRRLVVDQGVIVFLLLAGWQVARAGVWPAPASFPWAGGAPPVLPATLAERAAETGCARAGGVCCLFVPRGRDVWRMAHASAAASRRRSPARRTARRR